MEIVLTIINTVFFLGTWYFLGRGSIYRKLIEDYREALKLIDIQQAIIDKTYNRRNKSKEAEEEDGKQD